MIRNLVRRTTGPPARVRATVEPPLAFCYRLSPLYPTDEMERYLGATKLDPDRGFYHDRLREFMRFFDIGPVGFIRIVLRYGVPTGPRYKRTLYRKFEKGDTESELDAIYRQTAPYWVLRFLLRFERADDLDGFVTGLEEYGSGRNRPLQVLDYGCGVSDLGLAAAVQGHEVTICDLDDPKLEFARWRYERNGFDVSVVPVDDPDTLPSFDPGRFDVVVASEVMKQVGRPKALLSLFRRTLGDEGLLYCTQGTPESNWFGRKTGGTRLERAIDEGNSRAYRRLFNESFEVHDGAQYWWHRTDT